MAMLMAANTTDDHVAFRAATEAVLGLLARGKTVNEESVREWLGTSLNEDINRIARAMHYSVRIIDGPKPNEN